MTTPDNFTKVLLVAILLVLATIACRQPGPASARAADNVEYFVFGFTPDSQETFFQISARVNRVAEESKGRLLSIQSVIGLSGSAYVAVLEVPKGTLPRLQSQQKK
jgi:hypothetical protein